MTVYSCAGACSLAISVLTEHISSIEFISKLSRSQRSAVIAARWCGVHGIDDQGKDPI